MDCELKVYNEVEGRDTNLYHCNISTTYSNRRSHDYRCGNWKVIATNWFIMKYTKQLRDIIQFKMRYNLFAILRGLSILMRRFIGDVKLGNGLGFCLPCRTGNNKWQYRVLMEVRKKEVWLILWGPGIDDRRRDKW